MSNFEDLFLQKCTHIWQDIIVGSCYVHLFDKRDHSAPKHPYHLSLAPKLTLEGLCSTPPTNIFICCHKSWLNGLTTLPSIISLHHSLTKSVYKNDTGCDTSYRPRSPLFFLNLARGYFLHKGGNLAVGESFQLSMSLYRLSSNTFQPSSSCKPAFYTLYLFFTFFFWHFYTLHFEHIL